MNDMNELTNKLQQVMVPKAALIAYEYRENRYGNGMHYLELHPINDRGRMEAAMPVTYEFMDSLVESYTDDRRNVPHGKIPANMLWCDTRKGHERYIWYNPPGKRQMFFAGGLYQIYLSCPLRVSHHSMLAGIFPCGTFRLSSV